MGADYCFRRPLTINTSRAVISFTFDDFPQTALSVGGAILRKYNLAGTYYVSLDLAGKQDASGRMFSTSDLAELRDQGHELGCHTFSHCDSSSTVPHVFVDSVLSNRRALNACLPGVAFRTFSFPKSAPRAWTKHRVGKLFACCRGGGQTFNSHVADLNYLRAYFLEQAGGDARAVEQTIDRNRDARGWLIFATHDVCDKPSAYGCTPEFFERAVRYAVASGALILPVVQAWERLRRSAAVTSSSQ
jgi:peptidoglycan/xylan/chitin deacetylase (PgdA/CDA1 family)